MALPACELLVDSTAIVLLIYMCYGNVFM